MKCMCLFILSLIFINAHFSNLIKSFPGMGGGAPKIPAAVPKPAQAAMKSFVKDPKQFGKDLGKELLQAMKDAWEEFKKWVALYGKPYRPDSKEGQRRFKIFQQFYSFFILFRKDPSKKYKIKMNFYADFTQKEYRRLLGYKGKKSGLGGIGKQKKEKVH